MFTHIEYYSNWKVNQILSKLYYLNTFNQIVFRVVDSFFETIHHSPNTCIKSIHSALNKHTTCTTISIISKEFAENIIISNYNFLLLFLWSYTALICPYMGNITLSGWNMEIWQHIKYTNKWSSNRFIYRKNVGLKLK